MNGSVIVKFSDDTVTILNKEGFSMYCFIACESREGTSGFPLCWDVTTHFLESVRVSWYDGLIAYCSTSTLADRSSIFIPQPKSTPQFGVNAVEGSESAVSRRISVKERMVIGSDGSVNVETDEAISNVAIQNNSEVQYVAGLGVNDKDGVYYGICGIKLYHIAPLGIKPSNSVFLSIVPGHHITQNMAVESLNATGVLVDVSGSSTKSRTIGFDTNKDWSPVNENWIKHYSPGVDLRTILIKS